MTKIKCGMNICQFNNEMQCTLEEIQIKIRTFTVSITTKNSAVQNIPFCDSFKDLHD